MKCKASLCSFCIILLSNLSRFEQQKIIPKNRRMTSSKADSDRKFAMLASAKMIRSRLKQVAKANGYKNARQLTEAMNRYYNIRMSDSTLYPWWDDHIINFNRNTLDRLCKFLDASTGDIIQYIDDDLLKEKRVKRQTGK
jgi:DNA-binding Xre family transcriptional regulator